MTDQGGGRYTASVTAPAGVSGTLKISVVATKVGVASALELPITGGNWNSVGMATQATQPAAKPKAKKKKSPRRRGAQYQVRMMSKRTPRAGATGLENLRAGKMLALPEPLRPANNSDVQSFFAPKPGAAKRPRWRST